MSTFLRAIGLDDLSPEEWSRMSAEVLAQGRIFPGYAGHYRYACFGDSEISFGLYSGGGGDAISGFTVGGYDAGFRTNTFWGGVVTDLEEIPRENPLARCVHVLPARGDSAQPVPIRLMHADVLPSIVPGDFLIMQMACFPQTVRYYEALRKEEGEHGGRPPTGVALSVRHMVQAFSEEEARAVEPDLITLRASILAVRVQEPTGTPYSPRRPLVRVTVETEHGLLDVIHPLSMIREEARALLKPGNRVHVQGWLSADVAVGEYLQGAIYDYEHDMRLLAEAFALRRYGRIRSALAPDCLYLSHGEIRAHGPEDIISAFEDVRRKMERTDYFLGVAYGEVVREEEGEASLPYGGKCLVFLTPEREAHSLLFAWTDQDGKIAQLSVEYDVAYEVRYTSSFEEWRKDPADREEAQGGDAEDAGGAEDEDTSESSRDPGRVTGDMDAFFGAPLEAMGDVWDALYPGILKLLPVCLREGASCQIPDDDASPHAAMILYPGQSGVRVGCLIRQAEDKKSMELVSAYPVLPGYPNMLEIDARYTWSNGLSGEVAAHAQEALPRINFFVPAYFRDKDSFVPGASRLMRLSALALNLSRPKTSEFTLTTGQFYDTLLREFQEQNPTLSEEDFPAPVIRMDGMTAMFPTSYSCYAEVAAPVLEVVPLTFLDIPLYRLLIPVTRFEDTEIRVYLYVREDGMDGYVPKEGDDIHASIWLTGELDEDLSEMTVVQ